MARDEKCDLLCLDLEKAEALRTSLLAGDELADAAARARALADPTRLTLAAALGGTDELCVCDLAWIAGRPLNLVSHHLRALRGAGLAQSRREHKIVYYALTSEGRDLLSAITTAPDSGSLRGHRGAQANRAVSWPHPRSSPFKSRFIRATRYKRADKNGIFAGILLTFGPRDGATRRNAPSDQTTKMSICRHFKRRERRDSNPRPPA